MTDPTADPTEITAGPAPTVSFSAGPGRAWMTGPPPPPPGQDPAVPVLDPPPPPGAGRGPGRSAWRLGDLARQPPGLLGAAAILVAYGSAWLASLLSAVRHQPGLPAQQRMLDLLGPGSMAWGAILLLAVALATLAGAPSDAGTARARPGLPGTGAVGTGAVGTGLLVATGGATVAALLGILVELANFGHGIDAAFTGIVGRIGAAAVSGAALWWARRAYQATPR